MGTKRQLEVFVAVAIGGGYRRAADRLGISEASISKQISALERAWGGQLFDRGRGRVAQLSPLGERVLQSAKSALNLQNEIVRVADRHLGQFEPELMVRPYMLERFIRPNLSRLIEAGIPEETIYSVITDSAEMLAKVESKEHAFALYRGDLPSHHALQCVMLKETSLSIYSSPEIADAVRRGARTLRSVPFLRPQTDRLIRDFVMRTLNGAGIFPEAFAEGPQFVENWIEPVSSGKAAALFFDDHMTDLVQQGTLAPLASNIATSWFMLVASKHANQGLFKAIAGGCRAVLDRL